MVVDRLLISRRTSVFLMGCEVERGTFLGSTTIIRNVIWIPLSQVRDESGPDLRRHGVSQLTRESTCPVHLMSVPHPRTVSEIRQEVIEGGLASVDSNAVWAIVGVDARLGEVALQTGRVSE